jgi:UDP:flavonoid glycosyltransferase YjiC (YdhE family)
MFNVVKVESVPLNSNEYPRPRVQFHTQLAPCRAYENAHSAQWAEMHIAVVASSAPSHMHPHLAIVAELVRRGHRVSYLVGSHLAELVRPTGARFIGYESLLPGSPSAPPRWPDDDTAGMRMFLDDSIHVLPQVQAALADDRPQIVLYDIGGMVGPVAADLWGVPSAQLSPSAVAWDGYHEGLWYSVPMVAIPQAVDQPGNACQLEAIGVGRHLTADPPGPAEIRDAVLEVAADPQVRLRFNAIRDELHRVGGPGHAADAVEAYAADSRRP